MKIRFSYWLVSLLLILFLFSCSQVQKQDLNKDYVDNTTSGIETFPYSLYAISDNANFDVQFENETSEKEIVLENDIYRATLSSKGAVLKSLVLKSFKDADSELEIINKTYNSANAYMMYFGRDFNKPVNCVFEVLSHDNNSAIFQANIKVNNKDVKIKKTFILSRQYMIDVKIEIDKPELISSLTNKYIYTLEYAPQIGPKFVNNKKSHQNTRSFYIKRSSKKNKERIKFSQNIFTYEDDVDWMELTGQYFTLAFIPSNKALFDFAAFNDTNREARVYVSRCVDYSSKIEDDIYSYLGPQLKDSLKKFDYKEDNDFALSSLKLVKAMEGGGSLSWLQNILKMIMSLFYRFIPNWGASIVLLTLLVKIILYPLNAKSARSSAAMQRIAPELEKLKVQYKDNPMQLNQAMMALYKKNGISPISGFLPMLIQLPILFAIFGLLNKHFELRGAMFIPGWIEDLSSPDTVAIFPFTLPIIGNELHLLPIIYVFSMVFSMLYTQRSTAGASSNKGMQRFMTYGLPAILFITLYNASSGLHVYWSITNAISILQQIIESKKLKKEKDGKKIENKNKGSVVPPKAKKKNRR